MKKKYLCDVIHDWDLELHIHEGFVWVRDLIVQNELKKERWLVCVHDAGKFHAHNCTVLIIWPICDCEPSKNKDAAFPAFVLQHSLSKYWFSHKHFIYILHLEDVIIIIFLKRKCNSAFFSPFHCFCSSCNIWLKNKINQDKGCYPQGAPLTELKHPKHAVLKLHGAVEFGQVVIIDSQQLEKRQIKKKKINETLIESPQSSCLEFQKIQLLSKDKQERWKMPEGQEEL